MVIRTAKLTVAISRNLRAEEDAPLADGADEAQEEQAYGDLGHGAAHQRPRLAEEVEFERVRRVGHVDAVDDDEDGADEGHELRCVWVSQ